MAEVSEESSDWLFDYVLSFFSSPAWEVPILSFIDENCVIFDNEEENKFIYTDIHEQFRELVDGLLNQHLAEIGISTEDFAAICQKASTSADRDVNEEVLEQLLCMDDFISFKKLMVRRNVELDLETARAIQKGDDSRAIPVFTDEADPTKEFTALLKEKAERLDSCEAQVDDVPDDVDAEELAREDQQLRAAMESSIMEMDLLQLQEEMYQRELEQAISLSLSLEEEKLRKAKLEAKHVDEADDPVDELRAPHRSEEKEHGKERALDSKKDEDDDCKASSKPRKLNPIKASPGQTSSSSGGLGKRTDPYSLIAEIEDKKRVAEEALKRNQEALSQQKSMQAQLKSQAQLSESELAARAKYLKEQRDALINKKKQEREARLQHYQETGRKAKEDEVPSEIKQIAADSSITADDKSSEAEEKRMALRVALARRMKNELLESSAAKKHNSLFDELDDKISKVERLREENKQAQEEAAKMIQRHQQLRNKNMIIAIKAGLA